MPKLTSLSHSATHRVLIFGGPKTGKSELAGKLSEHFNLLWFDCENGWVTLTKLPQEWQERINVVSIPDSRTYPIAAETWLKVIKGLPARICHEHGKVDCALCKKDTSKTFEEVHLNALGPDTIVVFDSLTQFSNSCVANITKNQPDDYKLQLDDWGNLRVLIDKFLSQVQAAPYNIICITHEEQVPMEDGKIKLVPVSGSSKSSMNTAKYFDHVVYCEVRNKKHIAASSTAYANNIITGSRTGVELEKDAVATLLKIFKQQAHVGTQAVSAATTTAATTQTNGETNGHANEQSNVSRQPTAAEVALANLRARSSTGKTS